MTGFYSEMAKTNASGVHYFDKECIEALQEIGATVESNSGGCCVLVFGDESAECRGEPGCTVEIDLHCLSSLPFDAQEFLKTYEQCPGGEEDSCRRPGVAREKV